MKLKNSFFVILFLPFISSAATTLYYADALTVSSVTRNVWKTGDFSDDEALRITACRLSARYDISSFKFSLSPAQLSAVVVTNLSTGFYATQSSNPYRLLYIDRVNKVTSFAVTNNLTSFLMPLQTDFVSGTYAYVDNFDPLSYIDYFMISIPFEQRTQLLSAIIDIKNDVSSLVSLVASNRDINFSSYSIVSNLLASLDRQLFEVTNLQSSANTKLDSIASHTSDIYHINQYASLIYDKVCELIPATAPADTLALTFASAYGMEGYPYEALVAAGLASDLYDAQTKASDQNWAHLYLPGAISDQVERNALIQQFERDGISPPAGTTFRNLGTQQLRNIASYSYNTPASSNATLNAHSLDYLKQLKDNSDDINSGVQSLRDTLQTPQEVIVLNWPNDFYGAASLSNLFADAIQGFQAALTNFNPTYTWSDGTFFDRSFYNWRGLNTLDFSSHGNPDQLEIGISSFAFSPTGNFFTDVPNLIALQGRVSMDVANLIGLVAAYTQTNLVAMSSTQSLQDQYKEEFLQQATESLNEFSHSLSYSNLLERNTRFIDTSSVFSTPAGFTQIFSGDHSIPSHINLQLPSWHFGQDDQTTPDVGSTITIETAQYATFFQNCRYVFLFLYWGITVMIMIWLFRLFTRFISWIPLSLTGGGSHDTVSI